jgi:hypothetical protein
MRMMKQEPLPTHDGRPGNRGVIVNIASNLALVSRNGTRESDSFHGSGNVISTDEYPRSCV